MAIAHSILYKSIGNGLFVDAMNFSTLFIFWKDKLIILPPTIALQNKENFN